MPECNEGVEIGGLMWYPLKSAEVGLICLLRTKLYLSPFRRKFCLGDRPSNFGRMGAVRGSGLVQRNAQHNRQNVSAGSDTLSVSLCESIDKKIFHRDISPNIGRSGGVGRSGVVPGESLPSWA